MRFSPNEDDDVLDGCSGLQMISSVRFGILPVRIKVVGQEQPKTHQPARAAAILPTSSSKSCFPPCSRFTVPQDSEQSTERIFQVYYA